MSEIENMTGGVSLSLIVPVPVAVVIVAPLDGFDKVTVIVSADSEMLSSIVVTVTVAVV
jgi:hypothetical protein